MKKILFIHHGSGMGGAPQLLLKLLLELDLNLYDPVVWCVRRSSASELFEEHGFEVIINQNATLFLHISDGFYGIRHPHVVMRMLWGQVRSYFTAKKIIKTVQPDIIHINTSVIPGILRAAAKSPALVVVNILECLCPGYTGLRKNTIMLKTKKWGDRFVFMLPSEARRWRLLDHASTAVVFDFIELERFRNLEIQNDLRKECQIDEATPLIGYFGRFTYAKGIHLLLQALAILKGRKIKFHMVLVGPKNTQQIISFPHGKLSLEEFITSHDLVENITFTGERVQVEKLVVQCDILTAPFIEPHFSRLCGEAAAAGRPAVAFNIDGPGEEIVDGETGLLAEPFSIESLAEKLEVLCQSKAERLRMGQAAYQHGDRVFDSKANAQKVFKLYH